jgi:hypothetical protein
LVRRADLRACRWSKRFAVLYKVVQVRNRKPKWFTDCGSKFKREAPSGDT